MGESVGLTDRQQRCLRVIYDQDQENERSEMEQWSQGGRKRPAIAWRWMLYGIEPLTGADSPLRHRLKRANLLDLGTEATLEILVKHGLILCRYKPVQTGDPLIYVQITPRGRTLVRAAAAAQFGRAVPAGALRLWHWRALALAFKNRPAGVQHEYGSYGGISWNTWLRLKEHSAGALIEEYHTPDRSLPQTDQTELISWLRLSPLGEQFYRDNWQRYHNLYPDIDAPAPLEG